MIIHYLKIAIRNLMKYKVQNVVSIVALAVGIVTLAATHFAMGFLSKPNIMGEPYYDRCYSLRLKNIDTEAGKGVIAYIKQDFNASLTEGGGLASVEKIFVKNAYLMETDLLFYMPDSTTKKITDNFCFTQNEYLNFRAIRSAITGEKVPVLKDNEIFLSEYKARLIFGDKNPIGTKVKVQTLDDLYGYEKSFTIRDVYKVENIFEEFTPHAIVPFDENADYYNNNLGNLGSFYDVVVRKGYTIEQAVEEINSRLKPFGIEVMSVGTIQDRLSYYSNALLIRSIVYVISSLVLIASLIGFLKMQLQLFGMRSREVALRKVHGARRKSLFVLFFTEVGIILVLSFVLALFMSAWLTEYVEMNLSQHFEREGWVIEGVGGSLLTIIAVVAVVCVVAVWLALARILNMQRGMAAALGRSGGHAMRNSMLGVQLVVGLLFLSATMVIVQVVEFTKERMNVPGNDDYYKKNIMIEYTTFSTDDSSFEQLKEAVDHEVEGVENSFIATTSYCTIKGLSDNPELAAKYGKYYRTHFFENEDFIDFWQPAVNWMRPELKGKSYVLLGEGLYKPLDEIGLLSSGTLEFNYNPSMPIAGTYKSLPYFPDNIGLIYVHSPIDFLGKELIVVPRKGEYANVCDDIKAAMQRIDPTLVKPKIFNLREKMAEEVHGTENVERGAWLLSCISFMICILGIYSSISLDVRSRMKEVAVRKVHGAKRRDIALLFARLYLWLFGVAIVVTLPLVIMFGDFMSEMYEPMIPEGREVAPITALVTALLTILLVVALIVGYHIRKVMRLNPSDIIAKE